VSAVPAVVGWAMLAINLKSNTCLQAVLAGAAEDVWHGSQPLAFHCHWHLRDSLHFCFIICNLTINKNMLCARRVAM